MVLSDVARSTAYRLRKQGRDQEYIDRYLLDHKLLTNGARDLAPKKKGNPRKLVNNPVNPPSSPQIPQTQPDPPTKDLTEKELVNKLELMEKVGQKDFTEAMLQTLFYEALANIEDNEQRLKLIAIGTQFLDKKKGLKESKNETLDLSAADLQKLLETG